ncbi:sigma-70 family RNA polymerase sigma factor [Parapedobacter sp. ISTM3]|uniref:RNA polymerase sigma factor, sigma-70 family n=1 Tax=Parapedobacter luteus TaxID=623280 RepID=A0A1T5A643_9SPHI|nr:MULTISPECIES: sigma-70 family RNA polymerase sigma factor [Parapedobacter]MBK1440212.1 sigma-70 family RNA polymerase sigma factor [Parapedobacter sp. ISTM3]SKB30329.1 RNA polymerase sigma factor, sigma-70 family [Parapedobacter luteus]
MSEQNVLYLTNWKLFIKGDDRALRVMFDALVEELYTFGLHLCTDEELVKDAIQDLFLDLTRYRANLNPEVHVQAYLFSSLRRKLALAIKRDLGNTQLREQSAVHMFDFEWDPETNFIQREEEHVLYAKLRKELANLSAHQREALYLRFRAGLSYQEAAMVLDISVASCRTLIYRTVKQLREKLEVTKESISSILWLLTGPSK